MNCSKITIIAFFILINLFSCTSRPTNQVKTEKPMNIIMIAIDDMNNWAGTWEGIAKTPNIDLLTKEGTQFKNAHCVVPACNPSRVAILTGQRPETTGQYTNEGNFRDRSGGKERITLPQFLMSKGYETIEAGKIFHHPVGTGEIPKPLSDPISWTYQHKTQTGTPGSNLYQDENGYAKWLKGEDSFEGVEIKDYIRRHGIWGSIPYSKQECGDWKIAEFATEYLQKEHNDPFFLACGIFRPHSPQLAPQEYFNMYPLDSIQLPDAPISDLYDVPEIAKSNWSSSFARKLKTDTLEWKKAVQAYLACCTFADDCVGKIIDGLNNSRYKENTMVVLWTDHGWQLGHKDRWEKFSLWNQSTNSPFILKLPQNKHSLVIETPVSFLDIYPTIIDILGYNKPEYLEGHSLTPLMKNPHATWNFPAVITYQEGNNSVRFQNWNYIHYQDGSEELYDLTTDPNEFTNLANKEDYKDIIDELKMYLPQVHTKQDNYIPEG